MLSHQDRRCGLTKEHQITQLKGGKKDPGQWFSNWSWMEIITYNLQAKMISFNQTNLEINLNLGRADRPDILLWY